MVHDYALQATPPTSPPKAAAQSARRVAVVVALALLALEAAEIGLWATLAPHSWYASFPGLGHHWVEGDGPYNHHLVSDVGALFLGLAVLSIVALVSRNRAFTRATGAVWAITSAPHFLYHLTHRAGLGATDWIASVAGLGVWVALGAFCFLAALPDG